MIDDFFDWDDRSVQERLIAREMLESAGFAVVEFKSHEGDPPDCEGVLDGKHSAIEVTRLNHEKARALNVKALKANKPEEQVYFSWKRDDLLAKIQELIDKKEDHVKRYSGGPYERRVLVLHSDETVLIKATVEKYLEGATFRSRSFTDVVLGLSYETPGYPAFRLPLEPG